MVSVIVPVYKCERFIKRCIESIISQNLKDLELILVLDGEFDKSGEICRFYAQKDKRIKVISQCNSGVSVARNVGLKESSGKWIAFIDGDDWIEKDYLQKLVECGEEKNSDIVISDYIVECEFELHDESFFNDPSNLFRNLEKKELIKNCILSTSIGNTEAVTNIGVPWAKIYRKSFLQNYNLEFVPGLKRMQDSIFNLYAFYYSINIAYTSGNLYHYLKNTNSSTMAYRKDFAQCVKMYCKEVNRYIEFTKMYELTELLNAKMVVLALELIRLQYIPKDCELSFWEKINDIKKIITNDPFFLGIKNFKKGYLSQRQNIAGWLLKYTFIIPVYLYIWLKMIG